MEKILVVEDSKAFGTLLKEKIEKESELPVTWVKTLKEAQEAIAMKDSTFAAAVLDLNLPDAPQGEIIDEINKHNIPAIVFTGDTSESTRDMVWAKSMADYIIKDDPNSLDYTVAAIKKLITNRHSMVLIVDDSPVFRKIISELLYIQQYRVVIAESGEDALGILKNLPEIKLVITDYNMPGMNGCVLCQKIRKNLKKDDLAIIGISSEEDSKMAAHFIKSGANDFLMKQSFFVEEFYCRVGKCIEGINLIRMIREASVKDFLTGLYNRRYFFEAGASFYVNAKQSGKPLCCAMIDIDYFKSVNDNYGHDAGDIVLQKVAEILLKKNHEESITARFGGEEFCILAADKHLGAIKKLFSDLCNEISETLIGINNDSIMLKITVSIGVSTSESSSLDEMIKEADKLLYNAKDSGRNRVIFSS